MKNIFIFKKSYVVLGIITLLSVGVIVGNIFSSNNNALDLGYVEHRSELSKEIVRKKDAEIKNLLAEGRYKCCLTKPCSYCFFDTNHQDKKLVCDCLEDIMNGKHPCGECIGEILEGNGNPLISEYFATAIAEKLGDKHLPSLKQIIADKYDMPIYKQL